jgi:peptidyl-prolyl cis-trans isomerase B (cyclophilin B)
MVKNSPHLDGKYASFGKVTGGMDVADRIVSAKRDLNDKPLSEQKIKSVVIMI